MRRRPPAAPYAQALLLISVLAATPAFAQGNSVLFGRVTDASTHKPIADVVVTARSKALQAEQVMVTDESGDYRIPQLPPGTYSLHFDGPNYRPYAHEDIPLRLEQSIRLNVELLPEVAGNIEITIVGKPPTVDVTNTTTGVNVDTNTLRHLPLISPAGRGAATRSIESVAELAPGAQPDLYGTSIAGTTSPENGYVIDGVTVNDPAFGVSGSPLSVEFVQEVNVNTGGYLPEFGRATGGVISAVTKSGSNEFHGSVFGNLTPGLLAAPGHQIRQEASTIAGTTRLWNLGDFGAELGGPILKDKLWFYAGVAPNLTRYQVQRDLYATTGTDADGNPVQQQLPGASRSWFADQRSLQYLGKLTYNLNPDHSVSVSVFGSPTTSGGQGRFAISQSGRPEVAVVNGEYDALASLRTGDALDASVKWSSSFLDKHLLFDATLGWHHQVGSIRGVDGSKVGDTTGLATLPQTTWARTNPGPHSLLDFESIADPSLCDPAGTENATRCPVLNYVSGGPGYLLEAAYDRYQGKVVGTALLTLLGKHVVKAGLDVETTRFVQSKGVSGSVEYLEGDDGSYFSDFRQFGYLSGPDKVTIQTVQRADSRSVIAGGFVQDSWNLPFDVTVNAGLRYDTQQIFGGNQLALNLTNEWSPRIGFIYDFTHEGRSKAYASYARYYEAVPLDMADRNFPGERQVRSLHDAAICDPRTPSTCGEASRFEYRPALDANREWGAVGSGNTIVDPAITPQSSDEYAAGFEYAVIPDARAGVSYSHRTQNIVIEDMSRDDGFTYFIGNPGYGLAADFPKAQRDYDSVSVYLNKAFSDGWLAQVSYTWTSLRGNWEGLFRSDTGQLDPNITSDFDLISLLPNRTGPLAGDITHQVKVYGAKEFIISGGFFLDLGVGYRGNSGGPTNYLGAHDVYGPGEAFILPRGSGERLPWMHRIDVHAGVNYRLSKDSVVSLNAEAFNVFNFQAVTAVDNNYTFSSVLPIVNGKPSDLSDKLLTASGEPFDPHNINPNFGKPTAYQAPRTFRVGMRVTF